MTLEVTKRVKSKQYPSNALSFCILYLPPHADRSFTTVLTSFLERWKGKIAKAVTESSPAECLMKSHFLCSQHQDQMTIFWDISIHKNVPRLKTGTGNPKQLFNALNTILQAMTLILLFFFCCVRTQTEETLNTFP